MKENKLQRPDISKNILAIGLGATFGAWLGYTIVNGNGFNDNQEDNTNNQESTKHHKYTPSNPILPFKPEDIQKIKDYMLNKPERYQHQNIRDYSMFYFNINIGLKAPDLVNLKIGDIYKDGTIVDVIHIKERSMKSASKSVRVIPLREELRLLLNDYLTAIQDWNESHYLFQARGSLTKPMNVKSINSKIRKMKKDLGLKGNIGTLSMTKTFSREKVSQLLGDKDFADMEKIKHIGVSYSDVPTVYENGDII